MRRKKVRITLDVYEDQKDEFLGLIYLLKHGLKDKRWYTTKKRLLLDIEDDIHMSDEEFIEKKISSSEKKYLELLKYLTAMIYVESTDSIKAVPLNSFPPLYNVLPDNGQESIPVYKEEIKEEKEQSDEDFALAIENWIKGTFSQKKYKINETKKKIYDEIENFLFRSTHIKKAGLSTYKYKELINWILKTSEYLKCEVIDTDKFFHAAMNLDDSVLNQLPGVLNRGWFNDRMRNFRFGENISFDKWRKSNGYLLIGIVFERLKFNFSELAQEDKNNYYLRVVTGYVGTLLNIFESEDKYLERIKGKRDWRNYLAMNVEEYLSKYNELLQEEEKPNELI